ncbi:LPD38 domain-containing protein [Segatella buccae]
MPYDKIDQLYDALKADGAVSKDRNNFRNVMLAPGKDGYQNRKRLFDALKADGAVDSNSYEEFAQRLGLHAVKPAERKVQQTATPMTAAEREEFVQGAHEIAQQAQGAQRRMRNVVDYAKGNTGLHAKPVKLGQNKNVVERAAVDPVTGKMRKNFLTETGAEYENRKTADLEQNAIDDYKERVLHPIESELNDAYAERDRLAKMASGRGEALDNTMPAVAFGAGQAMTSGSIHRMSDEEYRQWQAATAANNERIKTLEAQRDKDKAGFWRGFADSTTDPNTWLFGIPGLADTAPLYATAQKVKNGQRLTESEKALLDNTIANRQAHGKYDGERGFLYRAGQISAQALPFVAEFLATGGFSGIADIGAKAGSRAAAKYGTNAASKWLIKNTGVLAGDVAAGWAMANTTGAAKTATDVFKRNMGQVSVDGSGAYKLEDGKSIGRSLWEGEAAQTLEYYTERLGEHLQIGNWLAKGAEKLGLSKLSKAINYMNTNKWLEKGGVQDYPSEVFEEEANIVLNAMLAGDNSISDLWDGKTQADIWGGMALSVGMMNVPKYAGTGYQTAQYYRYKHATDKAARVAGYQIAPEKWKPLQETIDGTTNDNMADVVSGIMSDTELRSEDKKAAADYAYNLLKMRGYNMGLMNATKDEVDSGDQADHSADESFTQGYNSEGSALTDAKTAYELQHQKIAEKYGEDTIAYADDNPVWYLHQLKEQGADEETQADFLAYINAKSAFDGVIQRAQDDLDDRITESSAMIDSRMHRQDGAIHPATMKYKDRKVYVVSGNVVMSDDGTMVDSSQSDDTLIIRDAETGELEFSDPASILSVDETIDPEEEKAAAAEAITQTFGKERADQIDGVLSMQQGDTYNIVDDEGKPHTVQVVQNNGDGSLAVTLDDAQEAIPMTAEQLQTWADNANVQRVRQQEEEAATALHPAKPEAETENGLPTYSINDEITLRGEDGLPVRGSVGAEENADGLIEVYTESPVNGKRVNMFTREELDSMLMQYNGEDVDAGGEVGETGTAESPQANTDERSLQEGVENAAQTVAPMPMTGEGEDAEPDFSRVAPARAHTYIYNEAGLNRNEGDAFVAANLKEAQKALEKAKKGEPKMGTSIAKYKKEQAAYQQIVDGAQRTVDYWNGVKAEQDKIVAEESRMRAEQQAAETRQAIGAELQRKEEEARKATEQAEVGTHNVAPAIKEKWDAVPKVEGAANEIVLPNGEKVAGHYVLVESGAASPSHNATNEFTKTEGFPIDENGQSVNDRDYERDKDAQRITREIAGNYDSRALQSPVVVSKDGIVLSGNGRTMAGELAAANNTDGAYIEHLQKYPQQYGFTPEQVQGMEHPRVLFVPDADMPYTAETFAKYNQQEMKGQSKTEHAVKLGKVVDDATFNRIIRLMNQYDTLGDFYADSKATHDAIGELQTAGVVAPAQVAEMFDGDGISAQGREMLENMLIGKAFESNPDAVRQITAFKSMRQSVITALAEISNNKALGDGYSLEKELADAIALVYNARNDKYKAGERVSEYARQGNLFQLDDGATVADFTNATTMMLADVLNDNRSTQLKKILAVYNHKAADSAAGQMDMFSGGVLTKRDILNEVKQLINYGTEQQQTEAIGQAVERRKADSIQQDGDTRGSGKGSGIDAPVNDGDYTLSDKKAENGERFYQDANGSIDLADIPEEVFDKIGKPKAPFRLTPSMLKHVFDRHGKEMGLSQADDAIDFVLDVMDNFDHVRQGAKNAIIFSIENSRNRTGRRAVTILLDSNSGEYYGIKTSGYERIEGLNKKPLLWEKGANETSATGVAPANVTTKEAQQGNGPTGSASNHSTGSASKDSKSSEIKQKYEDIFAKAERIARESEVKRKITEAEKETDVTPTEGQKEAGNYKKGHVTVDGLDVTIEQPKGSVRRGKDADGKEWESEMHNTYGYIKGTEGVDGDHIDIYLSENPASGHVFVIDQVNPKTGEFDEHKVMYGFPDAESAKQAYLSNYEDGWQGLGSITEVSKNDFKKWIDSSKRKTKPFAEYAAVKTQSANRVENKSSKDLSKSEKDVSLQSKSSEYENSRRNSQGTGRNRPKKLGENDAIGLRLESAGRESEKANGGSLGERIERERAAAEKFAAEHGALMSIDDLFSLGDIGPSGTESDTYFSRDGYVYKMNNLMHNPLVSDYLKRLSFHNKIFTNTPYELVGFVKSGKSLYPVVRQESVDFDRQGTKGEISSYMQSLGFVDDGDGVFHNNEYTVKDVKPKNVFKGKDGQLYVVDAEISENENNKANKESKQKTGNRLVTDERYEELKKRMRSKLGQLNMGVDPEMLAIGAEMAVYHIEKGARKFGEYAMGMIADLGDAIRPYLKAFYNGARDLPEMGGLSKEMTPYDEVNLFDVATIGTKGEELKPTLLDTAEQISNEQTVERNMNQETKDTNETDNIDNGTYSITKQYNKKKGTQIWVVRSNGERTDRETYLKRKEAAKQNGDGYWSSFVKGFVFNSPEDAQSFADDVFNTQTAGNNTQKSEEIMRGGFLDKKQHSGFETLTSKDEDAGKKEVEEPSSSNHIPDANKMVDGNNKKNLQRSNSIKKKDVSSQVDNDLFGDLFNEIESKTENNGKEKRTRTENQIGDDGILQGEPVGSWAADKNQLDGNIQESRNERHGDRRISEAASQGGLVRAERPVGRLQGLEVLKNTHNNRAERGVDYTPKGIDARIEANIKAIELMQQLVESGERATPEQMSVLRQFSGWGGLGKAFNENSRDWKATETAKKLRGLLGNEAYEQANMSRNSAYYTPAHIIDALWDTARAVGFEGGRVLEGSAGIGNIIGLMPADMSERSDIHAVEVDQTTGNILSLLYPDAHVDVQGFEQTKVPNGSIDLAITNVPFVTGLRVMDTTGDGDLSKKFHDIHDFCIAKNVRKLKEGGFGIFISSNGTLDNSQKLRDWVTGDGGADIVGAFRLNNETFGGTGATSDIIVVRKRVNGSKSTHAIDVSTSTGERTADYDTGETRKTKGQEIPVIKHLSMSYNKYFMEHPEYMGGEMHFGFEKGNTFRPTSKALYPTQGIDQNERLAKWVKSFSEKGEDVAMTVTPQADVSIYESLGENIKEGSMLLDSKGKLCVAQFGKTIPLAVNGNKVKGRSKEECFADYSNIKQALEDVLSYEAEHEDDANLRPLLEKLNVAYDHFVNTYGRLHKNTSISFLRNDVDYPNILALETFSESADKQGNRVQNYGKAEIFEKRVVEKEKLPEPKTINDGIIASIYQFGRVDVTYLSGKLGMNEDDIKKDIISKGLGFENPNSKQIEVSYEYLSGNVREKLRQALASNEHGEYDANIKALEKVVPMNIPAHLIDFTLGSSWITPKLYEDYVKEHTDIDVTLTNVGGTWFMKAPKWVNEEKNRAMGIKSDMLHKTIMGTSLIEAAIQNKTITVSETRKKRNGETETITDKDATAACASKIDEIRQEFKEWARGKMQANEEMSQKMEHAYNDMFNNYVPKAIPDDFVPEYFGGANHRIKLRPHQGKAVVRGTTQPLLLAHEVGTGKTFTLISTAMEMRRLGTARKPMIVVQNATVGQFVASAKELYPGAKVLTLEDKDHTADGRRNFYAKIKYNDWDMIVVPQSVFERIPDSEERQMAFIQDKIEEKMLVLEQMKVADQDENSVIARQAQREIDKMQEQLAALTDAISDKRKGKDEKKSAISRQNAEVKAREMLDRATDDVENFDDMGIDAILVDEAHEYKHLGFATAMQRGVKGVDPSFSKKAQGVYLKAQAVLEKNNGRNVVFATGTPISNTAAEIWTFMRYLMPADTMKDYGIYYFDDFVRNFGNLQQMLEFTTSGKFKENNRFAGYVNLPELVRIWSGITDTVRTDDQKALKDKIPDMEGDKAQDIYLPQTKALRSVMKYVKHQLSKYEDMSGKEKKENSHIPLTMYGIAKAAAVDARLVVADAQDDSNSKTNEAVRQTLRSLEETKAYKGTVALFADNYQNKKSGFNLYEDIKEKLIAQGVPAEQIVIMKSGMSVKKKLAIFDKVNNGDVRVIMGSTFTLGTGVNIQERLHTLIHIDAPNRPMDYTQRNGRILRQGNIHKDMDKPVRVLRFGVEDSLDVTAYQRLKTKGAIADSIMNGQQMMANSMENRVLEEDEDVFGDTVAQLSGSEYAMLKNQAEKDVRKYEAKKKQWEADQTYVHHQIPKLEGQIREEQKRFENNRKYLDIVTSTFDKASVLNIAIGKQKFTGTDEMSDFIKDYNKQIKGVEDELRNSMMSNKQIRKLTINFGNIPFEVKTVITSEVQENNGTLFSGTRRAMTYSCPTLGIDDAPVKQSLLRNALEDIAENVITGNDFRERIESTENALERDQNALAQVKERDGKPFEFGAELEKSKERLEEYSELMKQEMEEKEKKYAEIDAGVDAADDVVVAEEDEENVDDENLYREADDDTADYDFISIIPSVYTNKQREAYDLRQRRRIQDTARETAAKLGLGDKITIMETTDGLTGRKARAKGWFDTETGKIVIVLANHRNSEDVMQTILHEGVAHYGLRQLFGSHFDTFLDNVFQNADEEVRRTIVEMTANNGWDFRTATEEYLAKLAENTDFERAMQQGWWQRIKQLFLNMLHKIGFDGFTGVELSDNELRYILWRSYENLTEPGHYRSILGQAADIDMQSRLKVGNYEKKEFQQAGKAAESRALFRSGEERDRAMVRDEYNRMLDETSHKFTEAWTDSMVSLKKLQDAIAKSTGNKIEDWENAYMAENAMSSTSQAEINTYKATFFKDLVDAVNKLADESSYEDVVKYVMAKHGLERNEKMAERDFNAYIKENPNGTKTIDYFRNRDYSGLTALTDTNDVVDAEMMAAQMVEDFEEHHNVAELWQAVNAATKATLVKSYESGLIKKPEYEHIRDMFDYYVPLRGFDETTGDEVYNYFGGAHGAFNAPIKAAKGRKSLADDPFATIGNMAESAIMQGNRNKMKQKFLNLVLNHPSDAVSVNELYLKYDAVSKEWNPVFADNILPDDDADTVEKKISDFNERMEQLVEQDAGNYKRGRDAVDIPYRVLGRQLNEHQVHVKKNGRDYVLTINGNPEAAQALNGQTNPDSTQNPFYKAFKGIKNFMAAMFTQKNPAFLLGNLSRDAFYANSMVWVKEGANYAISYNRNWGKALAHLGKLIYKQKTGTLDRRNPLENMFYQFIMHGGETGYTFMNSVDDYKDTIAKMIKESRRSGWTPKTWIKFLDNQIDYLGRWAEDASRFAAYMTSREMGRSVERSVWDAKEITVNFNKKGAGAKAAGRWEKGNRLNVLQAWTAQSANELYIFWNAGVQGLSNIARAGKAHPGKLTAMAMTYFAAGTLLPMLQSAIASAMGGDDDEYYNLPEWVRRSNLCIYTPNGWVTIPLPIELRAFYGLGELLQGQMSDATNYHSDELTTKALEQVSQLLPIDFMEGGGGTMAFVPSYAKPFVENAVNKDWTGIPIYKKSDYNKNMPEWTKAYKSTSPELVALARQLNEISGGDKYTKGKIDVNPAEIEHLFEGYLGGLGSFVNQTKKTMMMPFNPNLREMRNVPIANKFFKAADERTKDRRITEEYYRYLDEYEKTAQKVSGYTREAKNGIAEYAEKIDFLFNSPEYERYQIVKGYKSSIDKIGQSLKAAPDDETRAELEGAIAEIRKEAVDVLRATEQ